jgi:hypothetical protein
MCEAPLDPTYAPNIQVPNSEVPEKPIERRGPIIGYVCRRQMPNGRVCGQRHDAAGQIPPAR